MPQRSAPAAPRLPVRRRNDILALVQRDGHVNVSELSKMLGASDDTIRRDLDALAAQGKLRRAHGGAVSLDMPQQTDEPTGRRRLVNIAAKTRIARRTSELIADGERLFINGGTTTLCVAEALSSRSRLTVLTNNLLIPAAVDENTRWDLYVLGGRVHAGSQVTTKTEGLSFPTSATADTAVIGIGGLAPASGFTVSLFEDAAAIEQMLKGSRRLVVVADSSKFEKVNLVPIQTSGHETTLVTDERPRESLLTWLDDNGIKLTVA